MICIGAILELLLLLLLLLFESLAQQFPLWFDLKGLNTFTVTLIIFFLRGDPIRLLYRRHLNLIRRNKYMINTMYSTKCEKHRADFGMMRAKAFRATFCFQSCVRKYLSKRVWKLISFRITDQKMWGLCMVVFANVCFQHIPTFFKLEKKSEHFFDDEKVPNFKIKFSFNSNQFVSCFFFP